MASVGTLFPTTSSTSPTSATTSSQSSTQSTQNAAAADPMASQATFLQLLVAQLQNQDPTQPVDGTTFVTQLAEFSDVEQNVATRQDMDAVSEKYLGVSTPPSEDSTTTSSDGSSSSTNSTNSITG